MYIKIGKSVKYNKKYHSVFIKIASNLSIHLIIEYELSGLNILQLKRLPWGSFYVFS